MPNWCFTTYKILGDQKQVEDIKSMLDELNALDKPRVENGFGELWLGCIIDYLGGDWNTISCRGEVTGYKLSENELTVYVETAWAESTGFRHFLASKFPEVSIYHVSEESGMGLYWTNDEFGTVFNIKYFLDTSDMDTEPEYFGSIEEVADHLNNNNTLGFRVQPDEAAIRKAIDEFMEIYEDDMYIALHKFEYVND